METTKTYKVWDIEWDLDGVDGDVTVPPTTSTIAVSTEYLEPEDAIADALSDYEGWLVLGFKYEEA